MKHVVIVMFAAFAMATGAMAGDPKFNAPPPAEGHSYPDCYCTNRGLKVPIGATSCLKIGGQEFTARCGWSLNNPAWRDKQQGCEPQPLSQSTPDSEFLQPG
ncbi:MAG: hypothetical protein AAF367_03670 [Pseudomonadota bacterium]